MYTVYIGGSPSAHTEHSYNITPALSRSIEFIRRLPPSTVSQNFFTQGSFALSRSLVVQVHFPGFFPPRRAALDSRNGGRPCTYLKDFAAEEEKLYYVFKS
ncbi:hypothetical protein RRG08_044361 [Elysia crispata]|uniref:Uncharacterized protein n=1 Tax=Elysia crispata TaxID=231223 RepID=A0AAE1AAB1_9GAST|nr:hypothetical protein RRG08_044361 [Elysia crispata]